MMLTCDINEPMYLHLISAGGGFLGGVSMLVYMRPTGVGEGMRRIVISTVAAGFLAATVAHKVFGAETPEMIASSAFLIGFVAWSILGAIARFFENRKGEDILSMVKSYRETPVLETPEVPHDNPPPRRGQIDNPDG